MAKPTAQQCHALTSYFMTAAAGREINVTVNRNKSRWGFESMLMDYTPAQVKELIDYYFDRYTTPTIEWFLFNYEKVDSAKQDYDKKKMRNAKVMADTEKRAKAWRDRWQQTKPE